MDIDELERLLDNIAPGGFVWLPYPLLEATFPEGLPQAKEWALRRGFAFRDDRVLREVGLARP